MRKTIPAALLGAAAAAFTLSARAADLRHRAEPPPLPALPVFTWTGFYAGVNAGYAASAARSGFVDPTYGSVTGGSGRGGFAGGGQIGYTYQAKPGSGLVVGVEADIQGTAFAKADAAYIGATPYYAVRPSLDYLGTVRARAGYAFDRVLIYATGGFAYGGGARSAYAASYPYAPSDSSRTGYAAGGGVEYALTDRMSAKVEALYVNLGRGSGGATIYDASVPAYFGPGRADPGFVLARGGINYRF